MIEITTNKPTNYNKENKMFVFKSLAIVAIAATALIAAPAANAEANAGPAHVASFSGAAGSLANH